MSLSYSKALGVLRKGSPSAKLSAKAFTQLVCGDSRVKPEFAKRSDIKDIVARYKKTGMIENVRRQQPVFADVSSLGDFHVVAGKLAMASQAFAQLPAVVRKRFDNKPSELIAFIQDKANLDEAIKLGLVAKKDPPKVDPPVVPPKP